MKPLHPPGNVKVRIFCPLGGGSVLIPRTASRDDLRNSVRSRLTRLSQIRARARVGQFDVTPCLVDRVASFVESGGCPECGRRDAVCLQPNFELCRVSEVMES